MTDNNQPITPPDELIAQWGKEAPRFRDAGVTREHYMTTQAARWGADQELEACINWLLLNGWGQAINGLRAARRPKPPSLKEQALVLIDTVEISQDACSSWDFSVVRRALESLPD